MRNRDRAEDHATHLREDYHRRNGSFAGDKAAVATWWMRRSDYLTWIDIVKDSVYPSEPLIRGGRVPLESRRRNPGLSVHACRRGG